MIEESEERLTEAQIEQLLDIIATTLPGGDTGEDEEGTETEGVYLMGIDTECNMFKTING